MGKKANGTTLLFSPTYTVKYFHVVFVGKRGVRALGCFFVKWNSNGALLEADLLDALFLYQFI